MRGNQFHHGCLPLKLFMLAAVRLCRILGETSRKNKKFPLFDVFASKKSGSLIIVNMILVSSPVLQETCYQTHKVGQLPLSFSIRFSCRARIKDGPV